MIYLALSLLLYSGLATAVASAAHGGDYLSKGYVVALHTLALPTVAPIFWLFYRRHRQAKAELDYLDGLPADIKSAYPIIGFAVAPVIAWCHRNPWPHLGPVPTRIQQEICGGFVCGFILALPTAIGLLWKLN